MILVLGRDPGATHADYLAIGSFLTDGTSQGITFTNRTTAATLATLAEGLPVRFTFQNLPGLPTDLSGPQAAHLWLDLATTDPAMAMPELGLGIQPFTSPGTLRILRDAPAAEGSGDRRTLLAFSLTGTLSGGLGDYQMGLNARDVPGEMSVWSDFLALDDTSAWSLALGLGPIDPGVRIDGAFLGGFQAGAMGSFATTAPPVPVPGPSSLLLTAIGALGLIAAPLRSTARPAKA